MMRIDQEDFNRRLELVKEGIALDLREAFADAAPKATGFLMRNIEFKITPNAITFSFNKK